MNFQALFAVFVLICLNASVSFGQQRGAQIRLTDKGLDYTIKEALKILAKDVKTKHFHDFSGSSGSTSFSVSNLKINSIYFGNGRLTTSANTGLTASVSSVSTSVTGRLKYKKKLFWHMSVRDTVDIRVSASDVSFTLSLTIGKRPDGKPSIAVNSCSSHVGSLSLRFSGSRVSWLYNLFRGLIERKMKGQLSKMMCSTATSSLRRRGAAEMDEFKVRKTVDDFSIVDYRMTAAPKFTSQYLDFFLRGEFFPKDDPKWQSSLQMPNFQTSPESGKMVYIWLSDYTVNTASEVYHKAGRLAITYDRHTKNISPLFKHILNTNKFKFLIPEMSRRFPNRPIALKVHSYKPPKMEAKSSEIFLYVYAAVTFSVELKNGKLFDAFSVNFDTKSAVTVSFKDQNIVGDLKQFSFTAKTSGSKIGPVNIPVSDPYVKALLTHGVIKAAQKALRKGFPVPNLDDVRLTNPDIKLGKGFVRVATDCVYVPK